jgi:hypothetical protein
MSSDLIAAYIRARVVLWVEDDETRQYLQGAWQQDPDITFLMGGGSESIRAVVADARKRGIDHVFGLVDRDLGKSNRSQWGGSGIAVFQPEVHELENWLIDPQAWAKLPPPYNPQSRSAADLAQRLQEAAAQMSWYMATRRVLAEARNRSGHWPRHPKPREVADEASAARWIAEEMLRTDWANQSAAVGKELNDDPARLALLREAEAEYSAHLRDGTWQARFSGKELVHAIFGYVRAAVESPTKSDYCRVLGAVQRDDNRVPAEVVDLLGALKSTAGL